MVVVMVIFAVDRFKEFDVLVHGFRDSHFVKGKIGSNTLHHPRKGYICHFYRMPLARFRSIWSGRETYAPRHLSLQLCPKIRHQYLYARRETRLVKGGLADVLLPDVLLGCTTVWAKRLCDVHRGQEPGRHVRYLL
jgi:hypothetical protein